MKKSGCWAVFGVGLSLVLMIVAWAVWTERAPEEEKALRLAVHAQLEAWFPEGMTAPEGTFGWIPRAGEAEAARVAVILLHGLDEPGDIWDDLVPALDDGRRFVTEFRYPNDQAIEASADALMAAWADAPPVERVVFVAHSMGGLVVRDFITRYSSRLKPNIVAGVILLGTPNHGSDWARFRVWLEIRDHFGKREEAEFSLFAGLRDGVGEAKIDLRPGSQFLIELNARSWPEGIPIYQVAGTLAGQTPPPEAAGPEPLGLPEALATAWRAWWQARGEDLGDGVVPLASAHLEGHSPPVMVAASHRGMIRQTVLEPGPAPALPLVVAWVEELEGDNSESDGPAIDGGE